MNRYIVVFSHDAVAEFHSSVQWGCENWGEEEAWSWYAEIRSSIRKILSEFPRSQPIAPDSFECEIEVRQML